MGKGKWAAGGYTPTGMMGHQEETIGVWVGGLADGRTGRYGGKVGWKSKTYTDG